MKTQSKHNLIVDGDMSGDISSAVIPISYQDNIGFILSWTTGGVPAGSIYVDVSINGTTWSVWAASTTLLSALTNPGNIVVGQTPFQFMKLRYVRSSGSGTLQVQMSGKAI